MITIYLVKTGNGHLQIHNTEIELETYTNHTINRPCFYESKYKWHRYEWICSSLSRLLYDCDVEEKGEPIPIEITADQYFRLFYPSISKELKFEVKEVLVEETGEFEDILLVYYIGKDYTNLYKGQPLVSYSKDRKMKFNNYFNELMFFKLDLEYMMKCNYIYDKGNHYFNEKY